MPKRAIPSVPKSATEHGRKLFDDTVKENLEIIMGRRVDAIEELSVDASTSDIIAKINEIIGRLQ